MRIIGIDPGSNITGYGIIDFINKEPKHIASGTVYVKGEHFPTRIKKIFTEINQLITAHNPNILAIEQVFMHKNASGALKLGQARGAAISAATFNDLTVHEYSAKQIKQAVVGYGAAAKAQVAHMVSLLLQIKTELKEDEADALACALCHSQQSLYNAKIDNARAM